jgi:hypothetical protein
MYTADSPLLGRQVIAIEQVNRFITGRAHGNYRPRDITEVIVPSYFRICLPVGVDPLVALAQMVHETGNLTSFWSQRPQRNPAGIGVTGQAQSEQPANLRDWAYNTQRMRWERGLSFPSWADDAIPAHIGRLLAYALTPGSGTVLQRSLIARALSFRSMPLEYQGTARTLKQLGRAHNPLGAQGAGWANPGTTYGESLARLATAMLQTPGN